MPTDFGPDAVAVRVPATSANLGPGFDALGLALSLYDDVVARIGTDGLIVDVAGEGTDVARGESHLVVRAMRAGFAYLGEQPPGLVLHCMNRIPHSRGLGSSAAAIVAGLVLARGLNKHGEELMTDAALLALAGEIEGHPDNVAAALLGGLTVAWRDDAEPARGMGGSARALRRDCDPTIAPVAFVPPFLADTQHARALLPASVPHADAAFGAGRAALLVAALTGGAPSATAGASELMAATQDRLHQPYRASVMAQTAGLVADLRAGGYPAVISGAGPSVLVLARGRIEAQKIVAYAPAGWRGLPLAVDLLGARIVPAEL